MVEEEYGYISGAEEETGYVFAPLLSVSEAARELGVGKRIIYQLIENGEIRTVKATGGGVLVEKKSLDEFRAAGRMP
jgi:excisionase family DNA binding protein